MLGRLGLPEGPLKAVAEPGEPDEAGGRWPPVDGYDPPPDDGPDGPDCGRAEGDGRPAPRTAAPAPDE